MFSWLPHLNSQVKILAIGRLLSEIGTGFTLFYAPIFFVERVGLSATEVGIALGSASIAGIAGRILGGSGADSPAWGRRGVLLISAAISAIASFVLATTATFLTLLVGNLLSGFGTGLYWPATEAVVADLTDGDERREAYAITRLADNIGLGIGVILGGALIGTTGAYRSLFVIDAISFIVFFGVVYFAIAETLKSNPSQVSKKRNWGAGSSWGMALRDRRLLVYVLANVIFTTYVSQTQSTLPLYFSKASGFSALIISALFTCQMIVAILTSIPAARALRRFNHPQALCISALLWGLGFLLIAVTGLTSTWQLAWAIVAMVVLAIASVSYTPSASSLVADMAPPNLRGIYLSINSLCWAAGYAIGPPLGGWAMDQSRAIIDGFWLVLAASVVIAIAILQYLNRILPEK